MKIKSYSREVIGSYEVVFAQPDIVVINLFQVVEMFPMVYQGMGEAKKFRVTDKNAATKTSKKKKMYVLRMSYSNEARYVSEEDYTRISDGLENIASK